MYKISELAHLVGLSRTALLHYEKQGLLNGKRLDNGYRVYTDKDVQRVRLLQQLQAAGLSLKECQACLSGKLDKPMLQQRLQSLVEEIEQKQQAHNMLAALLGERSMRQWHQSVEKSAPEAHFAWLKQQGFSEKEALHLKWLSKDMNEHDQYMQDFMTVFQPLESWGPGCDTDTIKAIRALPITPTQALDIGCGKGVSSLLLNEHTQARIVAVDNEAGAIAEFANTVQQLGLTERISVQCASMTELPFAEQSFDLILSEGAAYIMGFAAALKAWRPLLTADGVMAVSDLVWLTDERAGEAVEFWQGEYPDMQTVPTRLQQIEAAGYQLVEHFSLSQEAWQTYYEPLKQRVAEIENSMPNSQAVADIKRELAIYDNCLGQFGYQMFIIQKRQ